MVNPHFEWQFSTNTLISMEFGLGEFSHHWPQLGFLSGSLLELRKGTI